MIAQSRAINQCDVKRFRKMATQKITSFSKQTARTVADALIEAMQPVAASSTRHTSAVSVR